MTASRRPPAALTPSALPTLLLPEAEQKRAGIGRAIPSQAIVTDGPYRLTRNPGYLGMALASAGIVIVSNAPWALVPLSIAIALIDRGVIAREERYSEGEFGTAYLDYKRRVRRWI